MQITLLDNEVDLIVAGLNELLASYNRTIAKFPDDSEVQSVLKQVKTRIEKVLDKF